MFQSLHHSENFREKINSADNTPMTPKYKRHGSRVRLIGIKHVIINVAVYHYFSMSTLSDRLFLASDKCGELCKDPF